MCTCTSHDYGYLYCILYWNTLSDYDMEYDTVNDNVNDKVQLHKNTSSIDRLNDENLIALSGSFFR